MPIVYEQNYPPNTVEFSAIIRALKAAKPDMVFVASYPPDSAGILRAVNEIGVGDNVKIFGGGMVGLQFAAVLENHGLAAERRRQLQQLAAGAEHVLRGHQGVLRQVYAARHRSQGRSARLLPGAVRLCEGPDARGRGQRHQGFDQKALAKYLHENEHKTIVGPIAFSPDGERKVTATLQAQYRGVVDKNLDQFKTAGKQVILFPDNLKTGDLVPFEAARK